MGAIMGPFYNMAMSIEKLTGDFSAHAGHVIEPQ
jgi:hypothetical protein